MSNGYIYILQNPSYPNLLKIGKTTRTPFERAKEISSSAGVPQEFEIVYQIFAPNCDQAEIDIHSKLKTNRVSISREFFETSVIDAKSVITEIISNQLTNEIEELKSTLEIKVAAYRNELNRELCEKTSRLEELNEGHSNSPALFTQDQEMLVKAIKWRNIRILKRLLEKNTLLPTHDTKGKPLSEIAEENDNLDMYNNYMKEINLRQKREN